MLLPLLLPQLLPLLLLLLLPLLQSLKLMRVAACHQLLDLSPGLRLYKFCCRFVVPVL
jgi:hypothetical protein